MCQEVDYVIKIRNECRKPGQNIKYSTKIRDRGLFKARAFWILRKICKGIDLIVCQISLI